MNQEYLAKAQLKHSLRVQYKLLACCDLVTMWYMNIEISETRWNICGLGLLGHTHVTIHS